ncbi:MAG: V-type ATP synthase subunit E family protein [Myxococcota bacterium]
MALEDLIARLEQDADARVQAIRRKADEEVRALEAAEARAAAETAEQHLAKRRQALQASLRLELARARAQARAEELAARRKVLERVMQRAEALVPEVAASKAFREALPGHLTEALSYLEALRPVVRCRPELLSVLEPVVAGREDVKLIADEGADFGLVAEAADGSVSVDSTLKARLRRLEARLAVELSGELASSNGGGVS